MAINLEWAWPLLIGCWVYKYLRREISMADRGVYYEQTVRKAISDAALELPTLKLKPDIGGAYDATVVDIYIDLVRDNVYNSVGIEVKLDRKAQMGGTSVNYDMFSGDFFLTKKALGKIDPDTANLILTTARLTQGDLNNLLTFLREQEPVEYHQNITGLPVNASREAYENARMRGLLLPLNKYIRHNINFVHDHYAQKNCFYMQIGGMGLFYLKNNPLKLPVPQLKGDINIEMRFGRAGSRLNKEHGIRVAGGNYRIQGRLQMIGAHSPFSLDKKTDVLALFQ